MRISNTFRLALGTCAAAVALVSAALAGGPSTGQSPPHGATPVIVHTGDNGFDWGAAAIGAAAGIGAASAAVGGLTLARNS